MRILKIYPSSINERFIDEAAETLRSGGVLIFPTDGIYAIGCDPADASAVKAVCDLKGVDPRKAVFTLVCADLSQASSYAKIENAAFREIKDRIPGPYTFILPASPRLPKALKWCRTIGIRVPDNAIALRLASALGSPVLAMPVDWPEDYPDEGTDAESIALNYGGRASMMINGGHGSLDYPEEIDLTD